MFVACFRPCKLLCTLVWPPVGNRTHSELLDLWFVSTLLALIIVPLSVYQNTVFIYHTDVPWRHILVAVHQLEEQRDSREYEAFTDVSCKCQGCQRAITCGWKKNPLKQRYCYKCKYSLESLTTTYFPPFYTSLTVFPPEFLCEPISIGAIYAALWVQRNSTGNSKHSHWINYQLLFPGPVCF